MTVVRCFRCDHEIKPGKFRCTNCKAWTWAVSGANDKKEDGSVIIEDVKSADEDRIITHLLDDNLGGGLVTDAIVLLGGLPGAGKSTLLLQIAEVFCAIGECMYIAAEEGLPAIKARSDRLQVKTLRRLRLVPALGGVADIGSLLMERKPAGIILDSLDGLCGHDTEAEIRCLDIVKKYCDLLKAPALVISQVNKDADFSGLMAKQHAVDCLLTMMPDDDLASDNGEALRCVETLKNRHGRAFVRSYFEMTGRGLVPCNLPETPES